MGLANSIGNTNDSATEVGERYLKSSYKYYKLKVFKQLTVSVSMLLKALVIGSLLFLGLILSAIALAIVIGNKLGSVAMGFLSVGIIILVLAVVAYLTRNKINNVIVKKLSKTFFD
jgi:uncharacterized membrane protein YdbT with pleckstrin-like domain